MSLRASLECFATNRYFDRNFNRDAAKLLPGEYYVTDNDTLIVTVLGSCIAVCLRDTVSGFGGMNHFMLPYGNPSDPLSASARYGINAMELLVNHLLKIGAKRENFEAKIFGGGNVLQNFAISSVGERNSRFILDYMKTEKIKVQAEDLLDIFPRKVYFFPKTGKVLVKKLRSAHNETIFEREMEYDSRLKNIKVEGDIELFQLPPSQP